VVVLSLAAPPASLERDFQEKVGTIQKLVK
jgi:hypothetical protein